MCILGSPPAVVSAKQVSEEELHSESLLSQLLLQLETPSAYSAVQSLEPADVEAFTALVNPVTDPSRKEKAGVLDTIKLHLATTGLKAVYFQDKSSEKEDPTSSIAPMTDMDPITFAQSAAAGASMSESCPKHLHII